jgi:hypothetical protein
MEAAAVRVLYLRAQALQVAMVPLEEVAVHLQPVVSDTTLAAVAVAVVITLALMGVQAAVAAVEQVVTVIMQQPL